jgi:hypothetical protein
LRRFGLHAFTLTPSKSMFYAEAGPDVSLAPYKNPERAAFYNKPINAPERGVEQ